MLRSAGSWFSLSFFSLHVFASDKSRYAMIVHAQALIVVRNICVLSEDSQGEKGDECSQSSEMHQSV